MAGFELSSLDDVHRDFYLQATAIMDSNYGPPLLWDTAKLSTWYAVALLGRDQAGDGERAAKLLHNALTQQYEDPEFIQNLSSFKDTMEIPLASGKDPLWVSHIYDSYDPNNALFVTMAGIMIDSLFPDRIPSELLSKLREAIHRAVRGNIPRKQGWFGDDLCASYSNPFFMRCVCAAYVGHIMGDQELVSLSDFLKGWTDEALKLWEQYDSPGEFNSPTYAGITLMALGLAQYCPSGSRIAQVAPQLLKSTWDSLGETYNPSLLNVAGPWDRAYGYCMTRYFACIGIPIAAVVQNPKLYPLPKALDGCPHYTDLAMIPMQMIVASYVEQSLSNQTKQRFVTLEPHTYQAKSDFSPYDKKPREYTYCLSEGLSIGGVCFDETRIAGPKGEITQFVPGAIQWDSGKHGGGVGWIAIWPTTICSDVKVTETSMSITLPPSLDGSANTTKQIILHVSALPFLQLDRSSFTGSEQVLPGLKVRLSGNVADRAKRSLRFDNTTNLHGAAYYELVFDLTAMVGKEVPELRVDVTKTQPPEYPFVW